MTVKSLGSFLLFLPHYRPTQIILLSTLCDQEVDLAEPACHHMDQNARHGSVRNHTMVLTCAKHTHHKIKRFQTGFVKRHKGTQNSLFARNHYWRRRKDGYLGPNFAD
jgi:hypothetical protein